MSRAFIGWEGFEYEKGNIGLDIFMFFERTNGGLLKLGIYQPCCLGKAYMLQ
jgi:hypothetical protein